MESFNEDLIWDTIKDRAKDRIDYAGFAALFPFDPDNFLSSIIYGYAVGRPPQVITDKISSQVLMTGNTVDGEALGRFVAGSGTLLASEIALTVRALQMLNSGEDPEDVYELIAASL